MDEVETVVGRPASMVMLKQISALDEGCRTILANCPIAAFGYRDAGSISRTTFIGGTPGFARVHSPTRLSFRLSEPGNPQGPISLFFLLPGVGEILRVNGSVAAHQSSETTVDIDEAYIHCAQAVLRSRLWQPPAPLAPAMEITGDGPLREPGVAEFLAAAPFLALSSWDSAGGSDTSPRGDSHAVARVLDSHTLAIPDRRGNKRADTLHNLLQDSRLSFAALVPGRSGVLHVRGRGEITDDPALLKTMALRGIPPHAALLIDVEHAEVNGSDPVARSKMWTSASHLHRGAVPDLMALAGEHLAANTTRAKGGPPAFLLKVMGAIPGMTRLMRLVMNRAYRSGLRKEGYDDVAPTAGSLPAADRREPPERAVRIVEVRRETPSAVTLVLEEAGDSRGSFDFRPGQSFTLVTDIGGRPVRRAYSASSAPGSSRLEITVKRVDGGRFSTHVHRSLHAGDRLTVLGPSGAFHAEPQPPEQVVLVAAGSGVTPMMSMIRAQLAAGPSQGRIALLYSSRSPEEIIFADELTRLANDNPDRLAVTHVLSSRDGRLTADRLHQWLTGLSSAVDTHYYVCGPEALTEVVRRVLAGPYSCTVGNCGDCMVKLRSGEVAQNEPNCLTPQQKADGYVLTCVGCPLSQVVLDSADL